MLTHLTGTYDAKGKHTEITDLTAFTQEHADIALLKHVQLTPENRARIREWNLLLTKQGIARSVTPDRHLSHAIIAIEELDKVTNTLAKRLRDWYALFDPELEHAHPDHKDFVDHVIMASQRAQGTMGGDLSDDDLATLTAQAQLVSQLAAQRELLLEYLERNMQQHAPNLTALAGAMIGAKLISLAGGLARMSRMPAGTIQLLGAETALFRHLRNRNALPPKHGIIFNHQFIQRAPRRMHGKIARALADNIGIAVRIDFFKGEFMGDALRKRVEDKL